MKILQTWNETFIKNWSYRTNMLILLGLTKPIRFLIRCQGKRSPPNDTLSHHPKDNHLFCQNFYIVCDEGLLPEHGISLFHHWHHSMITGRLMSFLWWRFLVPTNFCATFCRVFLGTVSEFCVKHAECPVITIKRKADETPEDPVEDWLFHAILGLIFSVTFVDDAVYHFLRLGDIFNQNLLRVDDDMTACILLFIIDHSLHLASPVSPVPSSYFH